MLFLKISAYKMSVNPNGGMVSFEFQEKGNSVVLTGEVEIIEDEAKQEMWQEKKMLKI